MKFRHPLNPNRPPLSPHELDSSDPSTREARAVLELLRTVNVGKLIAYTGSGISRIYGYRTWTELATAAAARALAAIDALASDQQQKIKREYDAVKCEVTQRSAAKGELKDDELLALVNALLSYAEYAESTGIKDGKSQSTSAVSRARKDISCLFARPQGILVEDVRTRLKNLNIPDGFLGNVANKSLVASDIVPAIRLVLGPMDISTDNDHKATRLASTRSEIDPLHTLIRDFKINRLATLNYDVEIEACLEDLDYPYDTLTCDEEATSRTGATSTSTTLSPDITPALVTFAAKPTPKTAGYHIVHIHGSTKQPDSMVVTQDQYNRLYVAPNQNTATFHDALHLLFNGNPILFLGVGLSEDDIMRPIRSILPERGSDTRLYALMPSDTSARLNLAKIQQNKARYGINTIVYGRSCEDIPDAWHNFDRPSDPDRPRVPDRPRNFEHPTLKRLNTRRNEEHTDLIPLHAELSNIKEISASIPKDQDGNFSRIQSVKALKEIIANSGNYPRICSSRYYEFIAALPDPDSSPEWANRVADFVNNDLSSVAISVACNDMLHFIKAQAASWRRQWALVPDKGSSDNSNAHAYHGVEADDAYLNRVDKAASEYLQLPGPKSNLGFKPGMCILRFDEGRGKGSLFAAAARKFDLESEPNHTNYAFSAASTLRFDALEKMIEKAERKQNGASYLFVHNVESLMDRRHLASRKRAINYVTELAFRRLARLAYMDKALVVFTCSEPLTAQYLHDIAHFEADALKVTRTRYDWVAHLIQHSGQNWIRRVDVTDTHPFFCNIRPADELDPSLHQHEPLWLQAFRAKTKDYITNEAQLKSRVDSVDRSHRPSVVIEARLSQEEDHVLRAPNLQPRVEKVLQQVLMKWMFAFSLPTEALVFSKIKEVRTVIAEYSLKDEPRDLINSDLDNLIKSTLDKMKVKLLAFKLRDKNEAPRNRYILHKEVRHYLAHQRGLSFSWVSGREWSTLTLSNVLMDREPLLSRKDYQDSCELFSILVEDDDRECVRSAYGLLRGNLFLSNIMRAGLAYWDENERSSVLEEHLQRLLRLRACFDWKATEHNTPPLYPCDKVWIFNEIAVVSHLRGQFHDAILLWRELENSGEVKSNLAARCRIQLNLGACLIERGHFGEAQTLFVAVESSVVAEFGKSFSPSKSSDEKPFQADRRQAINILLPDGRRIPPEDVHPELLLLYALSQGYFAQVRMLCAKLEQARQQIRDVLTWSSMLDVAGLRGWLHYQASLIYASCGDTESSSSELELAMSLARNAQRPDLILSLETHEIEVKFRHSPPGDFSALHTMLRRLDNCRERASQLGSDRLLVATAIVKTRIMLTLSQAEGARKSVLEAICLSIRNGMRLRRISSLTLFCALMALRDETDGALQVLAEIRESAEAMRYIRAVLDLDRLEHALKLNEGIQNWARNASDSAPYLEGDSQPNANSSR
jgi:hypothetical protein